MAGRLPRRPLDYLGLLVGLPDASTIIFSVHADGKRDEVLDADVAFRSNTNSRWWRYIWVRRRAEIAANESFAPAIVATSSDAGW